MIMDQVKGKKYNHKVENHEDFTRLNVGARH